MDQLITILFLLGMLGLPAAGVALFSPKTLRLHSRWYALPLLLAIFLAAAIGMIISPDPASGDIEETRQGGWLLVFVWFGVAAFSHAMASRGRQPPPPPQSPRLHPDRLPEEVDARRRENQRLLLMERQHERVRISFIAPDEKKPRTKKARGTGLARSRLKETPGAPQSRIGTNAKFVYVDADGEVTDREIVNWSIAAGYIEGFCLARKQVRTFRLDRVDEWISAE